MAEARVPIIVGPTAVGKTAVGLALAAHWPVEIISADSRQIYRHLDIGTAKPSRKEQQRVTHHGLDLVNPGERYSAGRFARDATRWIEEVRARHRRPVVVGGTGLYIRALADGLFAEPPLDADRRRRLQHLTAEMDARELVRWAGRLDPGFRGGGRQRAARSVEVTLLTGRPLGYWQQAARQVGTVDPWYVVLSVPRPVLHQRIRRRVDEMLERGLVEEVAILVAEGHGQGAPGLDSLGIREVVDYLEGRRRREDLAEAIATGTRQYAKRQITWFRHQLDGPVLSLDATRPPEALAEAIVKAWATGPGGAVPPDEGQGRA